MNLNALREYIRNQLDMDAEELPNALLDSYLQEAFTRTIAMENRWPFYETRWNVAAIDENIALTPDIDPAGIVSLIDSTTGYRLMQIAYDLAEDTFVAGWSSANDPQYYSIFGAGIVLWPTPPDDFERDYALRGYRLPAAWQTAGASAIPDCDTRLHQLLAHYAIALCYAQQEDEVLEDVYMKRWQASFVAAHSAICQPRHHRPLVLNGGLIGGVSYNTVAWSNPPVAP